IKSVTVTRHREKQYYSSLTDTPRKILARQGVAGIDATSSATITSEAIINATAKALANGMK
ncbi:MAG: FMN-binding protein, partial [Planctomycetota bacterium]|nr:FMN-binding protein [Planctomycetota bacterium]